MGRHTSRSSCRNCMAAKSGNCSQRSLSWSSLVTCACDMNTAVADCRVTIQITRMTGRSASVSAIVFAWGFVEHFSMIGSLAFDWRRVPARVHRTLLLVPTHRPAHPAAADRSQRGTTASSLARRTRLQRLSWLYVYRRANAEPVRQDADGVG